MRFVPRNPDAPVTAARALGKDDPDIVGAHPARKICECLQFDRRVWCLAIEEVVRHAVADEVVAHRRLAAQRIDAELVPVKTPADGLAQVEGGTVAGFAGDRVALLVLARGAREPAKLQMLEQDFSFEPYAITLPRGDAGLRLAVNRELARLYRSGEISEILNHWFGAIGEPSVRVRIMTISKIV